VSTGRTLSPDVPGAPGVRGAPEVTATGDEADGLAALVVGDEEPAGRYVHAGPAVAAQAANKTLTTISASGRDQLSIGVSFRN
jgi:hypothetical protein